MDNDLFTRLTVPAAVAAAAFGIPGDLYHFTIDSLVAGSDQLLFKVHGWLLIIAMGLVLLALAGIAVRLAGREGRLDPVPMAVITMTFAGTLLAIGSISTEAFVMPEVGEAVADPTGYRLAVIIASYALFGFGWAAVAVVCARAGLVPRKVAAFLLVGGVIGFSPFPGSYILLLAGVALVALTIARRETALVQTSQPVSAARQPHGALEA